MLTNSSETKIQDQKKCGSGGSKEPHTDGDEGEHITVTNYNSSLWFHNIWYKGGTNQAMTLLFNSIRTSIPPW